MRKEKRRDIRGNETYIRFAYCKGIIGNMYLQNPVSFQALTLGNRYLSVQENEQIQVSQHQFLSENLMGLRIEREINVES